MRKIFYVILDTPKEAIPRLNATRQTQRLDQNSHGDLQRTVTFLKPRAS